MKEGIIVLAHGSKYQDAIIQNKNTAQLVEQKTGIKSISAFMELCEPSYHTAINYMVSENIDSIAILLMFLFEGYHTRVTIPHLIQETQKQYPHIKIRLSQVLQGDHPFIASILCDRYNEIQAKQ